MVGLAYGKYRQAFLNLLPLLRQPDTQYSPNEKFTFTNKIWQTISTVSNADVPFKLTHSTSDT